MGTPAVYLINFMARLLGLVLKINHALDRNFDTIVVSKFVGLGSIIQATPLLQTLRKKFPGARIVFVTTQGNATLLSHISEIDEIVTISDKSFLKIIHTSLRLVFTLWRLKPGLYIDLEFYSNYSSIITTLSKATNRLGFHKHDKTYRKGIYNYLVPFNNTLPISETYLQFAGLLGCVDIVTELKMDVGNKVSFADITKHTGLSVGERYIIINPNASDLRLERRWPKESFIQMINYLLKESAVHKVVMIGNKVESEYVNEILQSIPAHPNLVNSSGKLSLDELIVLIAHAELMITNDTGPMHMAFALGVKTISLFGPCSPNQYGAIKNGVTFYKAVHCSPCVHRFLIPPCKGNNICMKNISVEEVVGAVSSMVS